MDEITDVIALACEKLREEILGGKKLENGDSFVAVLNNCCIHISLTDGNFRTEFVPDVVRVDKTLSIYEEETYEWLVK